MDQDRNKVIAALEKDIYRRYLSVVRLQSDGRLELDKVCLDILSPEEGEKFDIISDCSSIIIARNAIPQHRGRIISNISFDIPKSKTKSHRYGKGRLRLPRAALRILLTCRVGFRAFRYGNEIALEAEPYIPPAGDQIWNAESIEALAPHILRSPRSILNIMCVAPTQQLVPDELGFRTVGDFWKTKFHQDPMDPEFTLLRCAEVECEHCKAGYPIVREAVWFPAIGYHYQQHYPRPMIIGFKLPAMLDVCQPLLEACSNSGSGYTQTGVIADGGLYKICMYQGKITVVKLSGDITPAPEERGLMKMALRELEQTIDRRETTT